MNTTSWNHNNHGWYEEDFNLEQIPFGSTHDRDSIWFFRGDGDFELLATLNNGGEFMEQAVFHALVMQTVAALNHAGEVDDVVALHRQDALDIISMDDE